MVPTSLSSKVLAATFLSALALGGCSESKAEGSAAATDTALCSLEGVMGLVPEFRDDEGTFSIPDPTTEPTEFVNAQRALLNVIEVALTQSMRLADPSETAVAEYPALRFPPAWRSAQLGIGTDGRQLTYPAAVPGQPKNLASFGGESFINGISPVPGSHSVFYQVKRPNSSIAALVSPVPTTMKCINRLVLAAPSSAGTSMPPAFVLGSEDGDAFLIVNFGVDLARSTNVAGQQVLTPGAELVVAIEWADSDATAQLRSTSSAAPSSAVSESAN